MVKTIGSMMNADLPGNEVSPWYVCHTGIHDIEGVIFFAYCILVIFFLTRNSIVTNLIRDSVSNQDFVALAKGKTNAKRPYSLARTTLAAWSVLISVTYLFYYLAGDGNAPDVNTNIMLLLGISAATTTTALVIDNMQMNYPRHQNQLSEGFWSDILSDENGISVHRFQNVLFTIVGMLIYIYKAFHLGDTFSLSALASLEHALKLKGLDLHWHQALWSSLPDLGTTLLGLMGISSSAYLGVKITENNPDTSGDLEITVKNIAGLDKLTYTVNGHPPVDMDVLTGVALVKKLQSTNYQVTIEGTFKPSVNETLPPAPATPVLVRKADVVSIKQGQLNQIYFDLKTI
jgi:hypothetical protein